MNNKKSPLSNAREARRIFINECFLDGMKSFSEISSFVRFLETTDFEIHDESEIL